MNPPKESFLQAGITLLRRQGDSILVSTALIGAGNLVGNTHLVSIVFGVVAGIWLRPLFDNDTVSKNLGSTKEEENSHEE